MRRAEPPSKNMSTNSPHSADEAHTESTPSPADTLLQQAMQSHRDGEIEKARKLYQQVLTLDADHVDGLHLFGLLHAQAGDDARAEQLIARAIELKPTEAMFHNNMGNLAMVAERLDDAQTHYQRAYALAPDRLDVVNNIALLQGRRGDLEASEQTFLKLIEAAPGFSDARQNLANLYFRDGRVALAVEQCAKGLVTAPRSRALRRLLGVAYGTLGFNEQAIALYRKWHAEEPDHPEPLHHLAGLTGEGVPDRASDDYVRATFNNFAKSFDAKLAELGYQAPALTAQAVTEVLGTPQGTLRVVDAGCGTGLCAPFLAPYAALLVGVDLSGPMLENAARRGQYHELVESDLTLFLDSRPASFDLMVSADTLCYFGKLDRFAEVAFASLCAGGWLVFTVEAWTDPPDDTAGSSPGYRLRSHGRYSHREDYVRQTLLSVGFLPPQLDAVVLRQEGGEPVHGWLVRTSVA